MMGFRTRGPARLGGGWMIRSCAALFLLGFAGPDPVLAQTEAEQDTTPAFLEAIEVEPLTLVAGQTGVRLALVVTAWGRRTSLPDSVDGPGDWTFRLAVDAPPPFLRNFTWEEGESGTLPPGERSFEAHLSFDVDANASAAGGEELNLLVLADDPGIIPAERRITIPLELRARPRTVIVAHPLGWDGVTDFVNPDDGAPFSRVLPAEAPLVFDEAWAFFTPAVDTIGPFMWRIVAPNGEVVSQGSRREPDDEESSTTAAGPEAPGAFVTRLPTYSLWNPGPRNRGAGPGTYTLEACERVETTPGVGVFGQGSGGLECTSWKENDSVEIGTAELRLKGLLFEQGAAAIDRRWDHFSIASGTIQWLDAPTGPDARSVRFEAEWMTPGGLALLSGQRPDRNAVARMAEGLREEVPGSDIRQVEAVGSDGGNLVVLAFNNRVGGTLELDLPDTLNLLSNDTLGTVSVQLDVQGGGFFAEYCSSVDPFFPTTRCSRSDSVVTSARMYRPIPVMGPPSRTLLADSEAEDSLPTGAGEDDMWNLGDPWGVLAVSGQAMDPVLLASGRENSVALMWPEWRPERSIPTREVVRVGALVRRQALRWYLPIEVRVGSSALYAFAVYGADAGPYDGPLPVVPEADQGSSGDGAVVVDDSTGTGEDVDPDAETPPGQEDPETDPGGPIDPAALDPDSPDISGLIRAWIAVARPSDTVDEDIDYHYDEWGRAVGIRGGGVITANAPPDDRGPNTPVAYVWGKRDLLDSVDHCTVGEYVVRSLDGSGIEECRGRYTPSPRAPDFSGRPISGVTDELESAGHPVTVNIVDWPTDPDLANTVVSQTPRPGERLRPGTTVDLGILGPYREPEPRGRTVVNVFGLGFEDARKILADSGFVVGTPRGGDPAPSRDLAFRVAEQSVAGGQTRTEGTEVSLTLFGPFREARDPDPATPPQPVETGPSCNDLVRAANRAQGRGDLSGAWELYRTALRNGCDNPGLSDAMDSVYQSPRCTQLIRDSRGAYDRGDFQSAIRTLRDAEREGCDMSGLGPLIDGTLTALETGVAEAMGQSCSGLAQEIAAARRQGEEGLAQALTTTALLQGCSGDQITTAASTPIPNQPRGGGPPVGTGGITLTEPRGGLVTTERVIPVSGRVTAPGTERITLVVNDEERLVTVVNGEFSTMVPLVSGQNVIQAFLTSTVYSDRVTVQADVAVADVWIQLTWDGPADIDLHLYQPDGEHVYYSDRTSSAGAELDVDNTQRDGPEHITMTRAISGEYRVAVRYYALRSRPGGDQVPWQVLVRLQGGAVTQRFSGVLNQRGEEVVVYTFQFR